MDINAEQITCDLNQLAEFRSQKDLLEIELLELSGRIEMEYQEAVNALLPPEIREALQELGHQKLQRLSDMSEEYTRKQSAVEDNIMSLDEKIRLEVANFGASVKGDFLQAVYGKGRESWDSKKLSGYAVAHPEVLEFRTIGSPMVTIRRVGN